MQMEAVGGKRFGASFHFSVSSGLTIPPLFFLAAMRRRLYRFRSNQTEHKIQRNRRMIDGRA